MGRLVFLSFFGLIALSLFPTPVSAWSGDLPSCDFPPAVTANWRNRLQELMGDTPLDNSQPFIAQGNGYGQFVFYYGRPITFYGGASNSFKHSNSTPNALIVYGDDGTEMFAMSDFTLPPETGDGVEDTQVCISYVNNATTADGYTGSMYSTFDFGGGSPSPTPTPTPSPTPAATGLNLNPIVLSDAQLASASDTQILAATYRLQLAQFAIVSAAVVFYVVYRFGLWFLPNWWRRQPLGGEK